MVGIVLRTYSFLIKKITITRLFTLFQTPEVVNSLSSQGQLPLGLALNGGSKAIADTLVDIGHADINAINGEVSDNETTNLLNDKIVFLLLLLIALTGLSTATRCHQTRR